MVLAYLMIVYYMIKHNMFPYDFGDENKLLVAFAFKTFMISYMVLGYFTDSIEFGITLGLQQLQAQVFKLNSVTEEKIRVSPDLFYLTLSLFSAVASITVVHLAIKNAYHFFYLNKSIELSYAEGDNANAEKLSKTRVWLTLSFFSPLIVIFMYIPSLSSGFLVPEIMTMNSFEILRIWLQFGVILLKAIMFYDELQFDFDENYLYIQKLMQNKNERLFKYIQLKMKLKFVNIWVTSFQYLSMFLIPTMLLFAYTHKFISLLYNPNLPNYDMSELAEKPSPDVIQSGVQHHYDAQEDVFMKDAQLSIYTSTFISHAMKQISIHGLIPTQLEKSILGFLIFSFYLSWFLVS